MEFRQLGNSGLKVPILSFGTGTFGGKGDFFAAWGNTDVQEATRLIDICLDSGINFFDTANGYSSGASEEILGKALAGRRDKVLISTKAVFPTSDDPNDSGSSRYHLIKACDDSLRRRDLHLHRWLAQQRLPLGRQPALLAASALPSSPLPAPARMTSISVRWSSIVGTS